MRSRTFPCAAILVVLALATASMPASAFPTVSESCDVLKSFRGEYSYGGLGLGAESNDGELAVWVIYHSPKAAETLLDLFPQCQQSGKAYVLATLQRADKAAFQSLTNAFCQETGDIITGSGCIQSSLTRTEFVTAIQKRKSGWAFDPSRKPIRRSSVTFLGNNRDVYAERQRWEKEQRESNDRAYAALEINAGLAAFTNLFRIEKAEEGEASTSGVYFFGASEWSADLLPRETMAFETMAEVIFPKSNGVAQVRIAPTELLGQLEQLVGLPFLKKLNKTLPVHCVRIRAAGDRLHWDTAEVERFEACLKTGVSIRNWVRFIVDAGSKPERMIGFYHPIGTEIYVVDGSLFENPAWREQYAKIAGKKPKRMKGANSWQYPDSKYLPVVDRSGTLRLLPSLEKQ